LALLNGKPTENIKIQIQYPDGTTIIKRTDKNGRVYIDGFDKAGIILLKSVIGNKTYTKKVFIIPKGKELYSLFYGLSYLIIEKKKMLYILWIILFILALIDAIILKRKYLSKQKKIALWLIKWIPAIIIVLFSLQLFLNILPIIIIMILLELILFKKTK